MATAQDHRPSADDHAGAPCPLPRRHWGGPVVGGFYLSMGGVHLGLVAADTETYRHFADDGLFGFVRDGWQDVFMAHPAAFGLLLAAGETVLGILLLRGGRAADVGWAGVIAFHVLLMLFGFGFWLWSLPALVRAGALARRDQTAHLVVTPHHLPRRHEMSRRPRQVTSLRRVVRAGESCTERAQHAALAVAHRRRVHPGAARGPRAASCPSPIPTAATWPSAAALPSSTRPWPRSCDSA